LLVAGVKQNSPSRRWLMLSAWKRMFVKNENGKAE
jgi:hypothetical protein